MNEKYLVWSKAILVNSLKQQKRTDALFGL